jgi:hypothetical protein
MEACSVSFEAPDFMHIREVREQEHTQTNMQ